MKCFTGLCVVLRVLCWAKSNHTKDYTKHPSYLTIMIAQWDSSLAALPVARVMIPQWDSSLSVLPVARVMIPQWDSSLSVLPVAQVMIAQWDGSLSVLPVARVQFPTMVEYFKGLFPSYTCMLPYTQFREYQWAECHPLQYPDFADQTGVFRADSCVAPSMNFDLPCLCSEWLAVSEAISLAIYRYNLAKTRRLLGCKIHYSDYESRTVKLIFPRAVKQLESIYTQNLSHHLKWLTKDTHTHKHTHKHTALSLAE